MAIEENSELDSDRPLQSEKSERFGFTQIAEKLAESVISAAASDGMVIGIEGKWGSGKTSLLNLLQLAIAKKQPDQVAVISFSPWISGDKDGFVSQLLVLLSEEIDRRSKPESKNSKSELADNLLKYGAQAGHGLAPFLKLAGFVMPGFGAAAEGATITANLLESWRKEKSVFDRKREISDQLAAQDVRFVILLDDLDRLEPKDAVEIIRLVRSVADFPNVVYLLCYDKAVLAHAVEKCLEVENGAAFLQKIVQVSFKIPNPEPFDLRYWLMDELMPLYERETGGELGRDEYSILFAAVSGSGSLLETPRDVKNVLNSVKFHFPPVKECVYFPDLCWLHILRITDPELHSWVESYIPEWALNSVGDAIATSDDAAKFGGQLKKLMTSESVDSLRSLWTLSDWIPGVVPNSFGNGATGVFNRVSDKEILELEDLKRLGSPAHYRYYFAFANPQSSMTQADFHKILLVDCDTEGDVRRELIRLSAERRLAGSSWFDCVIDRIARQDFGRLEASNLAALSFVIADVVDESAKANFLRGDGGRSLTFHSAGDAVYKILDRLRQSDQQKFTAAFVRIFGASASIGWLVDFLLNDEMRRHGKNGGQSNSSKKYLTKAELEKARQQVLQRLKGEIDTKRLFEAPNLVSTLFRWSEIAGDNFDGPKKWFGEQMASDGAFLDLLEKMRGLMVGDRVYRPVYKGYIEPFSDWYAVLARLNSIANGSSNSLDEIKKAAELLAAVREKD
jgi:KAP family P-loop domain